MVTPKKAYVYTYALIFVFTNYFNIKTTLIQKFNSCILWTSECVIAEDF